MEDLMEIFFGGHGGVSGVGGYGIERLNRVKIRH